MMNLFIPKGIKIGSLTITFYAICIIIGAIVAYQLSRHYLMKKGYKKAAVYTKAQIQKKKRILSTYRSQRSIYTFGHMNPYENWTTAK